MLMLISPAKTLDYQRPATTTRYSQPELLADSAELIAILRDKSPPELAALMGISDTLAVLNTGRYHDWQPPFTPGNAKQAVYAFMGDVYEGLDATSLSEQALGYLQSHMRILSGLYGVLRPLDLMQAYRLEMGTRLANPHGRNLYAFWGDKITHCVRQALVSSGEPVLVNLASEEYFKSVRPAQLAARIVTPVFEEWTNGRYKIVSFYAKRARGLMARWAAVHNVEQAEQLKAFDSEGYTLDAAASGADKWVFRRQR